MIDANIVSVSADPYAIQTKIDSNDQEMANVPYREAIGFLMFVALVSRPDIECAVNVVSRYANKYKRSHWLAVKRIFKYLLGTFKFGLLYGNQGNNKLLIGYSDADFARDVDTRRST